MSHLISDIAEQEKIRENVREIMSPIEVIAPTASLLEVDETFNRIGNTILAVVDESCRPLGIIYRSRINELFGMRLGRELFEKRLVSEYMDTDYYQFEDTTSLPDVAAKMTVDSGDEYLTQHFLIVQRGVVIGVGTAKRLLNVINEAKIRQAIHSNPLTLMAGQVPLSELQDKLRREQTPYSVVYFDLDHFKVFNDCYGHRRGDEAILLLADILREQQTKNTYLFHIGGDDFEAILLNDDVVAWATEVKNQFESRVVSLYDQEHAADGCITGLDRFGQERSFPLMTVATAIILPAYTQQSAQKVSSWTAIAKKQAKTTGEVCVFHGGLVAVG